MTDIIMKNYNVLQNKNKIHYFQCNDLYDGSLVKFYRLRSSKMTNSNFKQIFKCEILLYCFLILVNQFVREKIFCDKFLQDNIPSFRSCVCRSITVKF